MKIKCIFLVLWLSVFVSAASAQTALQTLANSMSAGQWRELTTNNINTVMHQPGGDENVLTYAADAAWDPVSQKLYYIGNEHIDGNFSEGQRFITYNAVTNGWDFTVPPFSQSGATRHGYYLHAIDRGRQQIYRSLVNRADYWERYNINTGVWNELMNPVNQSNSACCGVADWSTALDGMLAVFGDGPSYQGGTGGGVVYLFRAVTQTWEIVKANIPGLIGAGTLVVGGYTPKNGGLLVFGVGQTNWYKMDTAFNLTNLNPIPFDPFSPPSGDFATFNYDPSTQDFIVLSDDSHDIFQFNPVTDVWTQLNPDGFTNMSDWNVIGETIDELGVIMYVACQTGENGLCHVYLYKHQPTAADTTPPTAPTSLTANAPDSTKVDLSWGASTDNVAVGGYRIERCTGSGCLNFIQIAAPSGLGLTYTDLNVVANTTYSYRVRARDISNNLSNYSNTAVETVPNIPSSDNFEARCAAAGVVRCIGFDTISDMNGSWSVNPVGIVDKGFGYLPVVDTTIKASGAGSMKMFIPSGIDGNRMADWYANFSDDYSVQFGANQDFYVQFRVRFDDNFLFAMRGNPNGSDNFGPTPSKQGMVGTGSVSAGGGANQSFTSCSALEIVWQNTNARGVPQMYHNCGRYSPLQAGSGSSPWNSTDFLVQSTANPPGCWHYAPNFNSRIPPLGSCIPYAANEWMTFQVHVHTGPLVEVNMTSDLNIQRWFYVNSHIDAWVSRQNGPKTQVVNYGPIDLGGWDGNSIQQKYGQQWLLPYSNGYPFPLDATTWYDELIISTQPIAEPGEETTPPPVSNVIFDAVTSGTCKGTLASSLTCPITVTSTVNREMILGVCIWDFGGVNDVTSITVNGSSIGINSLAEESNVNGAFGHLFQLTNPPSGAYDVVFNFTGAVYVSAVAATYTGASQSVPPVAATSTQGGSGTNPSITVTTDVGDLVVDLACSDTSSGIPLEAAAGQTDRRDVAQVNATLGTSEKAAGTTSTVMSWTDNGVQWVHLGAAIKEASFASSAAPVVLLRRRRSF